MSKNIAIIFAGGSGARMGSGIPKQFIEIDGKPIIIYTLDNFQDHDEIDKIYISCKAGYIDKLERLCRRFAIDKVAGIVQGGETGQDSIYNALLAAAAENDEKDIVLLHDGVRPFITSELISKNIACVKENGSAVSCTPMFETPIVSESGSTVDETPKRDNIFTAQAPQSFYLGDILKVHEQVRKINRNYEGIVDSCTLMRSVGKDVSIVHGNRGNIKVTTPEDLYLLRGLLNYKEVRQAFGLTEKEVPGSLKK